MVAPGAPPRLDLPVAHGPAGLGGGRALGDVPLPGRFRRVVASGRDSGTSADCGVAAAAVRLVCRAAKPVREGQEVTKRRMTFASVAFLSAALAISARAQESDRDSPVLDLSAPLRAALIGEMQQVDANMQRIVAALARADWPALVEASRNIEGSFILEQELSAEQRSQLRATLPDHFLTFDARFHDTADRLAAAAQKRDAELAAFYTYKLAESCVSCHAQYAPHRFPGFEPGNRKDH